MENNRGPRQIDVRGTYAPHGRPIVTIETPEDLVTHGIQVPKKAIEATWGLNGVTIYEAAMREKK